MERKGIGLVSVLSLFLLLDGTLGATDASPDEMPSDIVGHGDLTD